MSPLHPIRIVILGAGFGGVYTYKKLHELFHNDEGIELILVNNTNYFLFTPLLHEVATGGISPDHIVEPLRKTLGCCMGAFYLGEVEKISTKTKSIETTAGSISYDYCVVALGSQTAFYGTKGSEYTFTLKSLSDAVRLKNHCIRMFEEASKIHDEKILDAMLRFVIVGGGPTGVELAAEMHELFYDTFGKFYKEQDLLSHVQIIMVHKQDEILSQFSPSIRKQSMNVLRKKGIIIKTKCAVTQVGASHVVLDTGEHINTKTAVWVAGIEPRQVKCDMVLKKDEQKRMIVNEYMQAGGQNELFALGDCASYISSGSSRSLPALAQVATAQGETVALNIYNMIKGKKCVPLHYHHKGDLLSLGQWMAIAEIGPLHVVGHFAWWLWRTVYLFKLISWHKKIKVAVDWTINLFSPRDISQL